MIVGKLFVITISYLNYQSTSLNTRICEPGFVAQESRPYTSENWDKLSTLEVAYTFARREFQILSSPRCGLILAIPPFPGKLERGNYVVVALV